MKKVDFGKYPHSRERAEEKYSMLPSIRSSSEAVIGTTINGIVTSWNLAAEKMYGYSKKEIVGQSMMLLTRPKGAKQNYEMREKIKMGDYIDQLESIRKRKDGTEFYVSMDIFPIKNSDGNIVGMSNIERDITERKQAEKVLRESETRYRRLFEAAQDGILILDAETGKITDINPFLQQMLGYSYFDVIGKTLWEIGLFKDILANYENFTELQNREYIRYEDLPLETKGGKRKQVEFVSNVYLVNGKKTIQCNIRDITERKLAEAHLQASEERYRRLVEFSPDAIMVHSGGKLVYVNPAAIRLLGAHDASELLGKPFIDIIHPIYRETVRLWIDAGMMENTKLPWIEEKYIRLDGVTVDVEVTGLPIEYDGIPSMHMVARDITEQKKLQQELFQSQKIQSIGTLASGIAHDFNNILGIILGYTSLIEKDKLGVQKKSDSFAAINQAIQRGAALVRQILSFARKTDILFEPLSLADIVEELFSMLTQTSPKIITFKKIFPADIPFILADRTQIHQVLLNLCVNAMDAMPNGGSIIIKAEKKTGQQVKEQFPAADQELYVCLNVTDTGEGMNEATRSCVFDPFFTTKTKGKGTGLGLSVVYSVVQAHQGFINVESELGHGTTFRFYFPVPIISRKPIDFQQVEPFEIGGTETILLVEDEELLIEMVRFLLESKGYKVLVARDGAEAMEVYKKNRKEIALVLTDMGLPLVTGMEEFKKLKEIDPNVKVIFASGFIEPDVKSDLVNSGAMGFLQKPYMPDEIYRVLREVLDRK